MSLIDNTVVNPSIKGMRKRAQTCSPFSNELLSTILFGYDYLCINPCRTHGFSVPDTGNGSSAAKIICGYMNDSHILLHDYSENRH